MRVYKFINLEFGLKALTEQRLKITTVDELNDPFELLPFDVRDRNNRAVLHLTKKHFSRNHGLLCFSSTWHDPVLWAHYAALHKGICIGFDVPDELCIPVQYVNHRLPFPQVRDLDDLHVGTDLLCTKYANWQYEQEVRLFTDLHEIENGRYYKSFDNSLQPAVVIVGVQCDKPRSLFESASAGLRRHIQLIKARPGFTDFKVVEDKRGFQKRPQLSLPRQR